MPKHSKPRAGSLQFWPRKRAKKILPSVNWDAIGLRSDSDSKEIGLKGFICYKVGMSSAFVRDNTENSMTKTKRIVVPVTILECPLMKIYSVRFYKDKKVAKDVIVGFDDKLKSKLKKPKTLGKIDKISGEYDDLKVIVYSNVKSTGLKNSPDLSEIGLSGSFEEKLKFVQDKIESGFSVSDVFNEGLVDIRGITKGKGLQGPVKRFGISLKDHKSEKGRRRPGSLGPWTPSRVTFRTPMAGQLGFQTRPEYNKLIVNIGKTSEKDLNKQEGFHRYGKIKNDYIILKGSIPGVKKRAILITKPLRPTKLTSKQKLEFVNLR